MAISPSQYPLLVAAPMLQDYLVDKDSGAPLAAGIVTFYKDNARTILKNVYYQTGTPGNYSYIPLPNPNTLTAVGTIADDGGNDVIPFYFPYDEDDSDVAEPYYVTIESSGHIPQFTREGFPFVSGSDSPINDQQDAVNLIPNGQFTAHNDLPNDGLFPNGTTEVVVAQGGAVGWYYTKNNTSTDTDFVTFTQILQEPDNLTGNPRFSINITCTSTSGNDTFKELRMRFNNVNRFASDTQAYTFSFSGMSNSASNTGVILQLIKNFGSGGSSTQLINLQNYTLAPGTYTQYSTSFVFGTNFGATIGPDNDDYIELAMVLPSDATFDVDMTDFILSPGFIIFNDYPERPDNMVFANAITGSVPTPNPDGSDFYLPIVATPAGANYDDSYVGQVIGSIRSTLDGWLLCDGSTYLTTDYSALGVPYSRLQAILRAANPATNNVPLYGTGSTFVTQCNSHTSSVNARIVTNQAGSETGATEGAIPTGFTFGTIHTGQTIALKAYSNGTNNLIGIANAVGAVTAATAGTSGFTVSQTVNNALTYSAFTVSTIAAAAMAAGSYFTFSVPGTSYYCWFKINGAGADPAPGGTGIQVNILSTYSATEVSVVVREAISGFQISSVGFVAAAGIPPGAFFTFSADSTSYAVWYEVNGAGTAPVSGTPIKVTLTGAETDQQVRDTTYNAINGYSFAVPDFRGEFLRGVRDTGQFDLNAATRYSMISGVFGNAIGTFELDTFQSHTHSMVAHTHTAGVNPFISVDLGNANAVQFTPPNLSNSNTGSAETRPVNANINWFIKY